jgi:hypothetical protein
LALVVRENTELAVAGGGEGVSYELHLSHASKKNDTLCMHVIVKNTKKEGYEKAIKVKKW